MTQQKKGFRDPMDFVRGAASEQGAQAEESKPIDETTKPTFPRREAKQTVNMRMPKDLYDELRDFWRMTDISMTSVIVEGARKELAALKKKYGLD